MTRYERLLGLVQEEIQKYKDILLAIKKKVGTVATKTANRGELKEYLDHIGIVNLDYIADLPVYRFTEDERDKVKARLEDALAREAEYTRLLSSEAERKKIYAGELRDVLKRYNRGDYSNVE